MNTTIENTELIDQLVRKVRQKFPYILQLSSNREEEVDSLYLLTLEMGGSLKLTVKNRVLTYAPPMTITPEEYYQNQATFKLIYAHVSDPLCLALEDAGMDKYQSTFWKD